MLPAAAVRAHERERDARGDLREVRLALVLPGGVSLAVYIFGVVAEIHRLVRVSALDEAGTESISSPVAAVYFDLLRSLGENERVRTRVVVDVIAGTSAGGVNAVFLAKAIAHNLPLDFLGDLWLKQADIGRLMRGPVFLPRRLRVPWLAATLPWRSPLRGDTILRWFHDALVCMDASRAESLTATSLVPPGQTLQLYVTLTDLGGLRTTDTVLGPKLTHRHVLSFRYSPDGVDDFQPAANDDLAFAARATAAFPGAFPPVRLGELREVLGGEASHGLTALIHEYALADADPDATAFIDGGILDNRPFRPALRGVRAAAPASFEVNRRVLYIDPVERTGETQPMRTDPVHVLGALARIVGTELPDEVEEVSRANDQAVELRRIIEAAFATIEHQLREIVGPQLALDDEESWRRADTAISEIAKTHSGYAYRTYFELRTREAVRQVSTMLGALCGYPSTSRQHLAVVRVLESWAEHVGLRRVGTRADEEWRFTDEQQWRIVTSVDLTFERRRLLFTRNGVNRLYPRLRRPGAPARAELDLVKERVNLGLWQLDHAVADTFAPQYVDAVSGLFGDHIVEQVDPEAANEFAKANAEAISGLVESLANALASPLRNVPMETWLTLVKATARWNQVVRWELIIRFLGYPLWDVLLYPIQAVTGASEAAEPTPIRLSPSDTRTLPQQPKLMGTSRHHFGAFYSRRARENDYLWGRLDGAEHLVTLLLGADHPDHVKWCRRLLLAVLAEQGPALPKVRDVVGRLQAELRSR